MESIVLECKICIVKYEISVVVPRVLNCGHSICTKCLIEIIKTTAKCPICRTPLRKLKITDFPVNYDLLQLVETLRTVSNSTNSTNAKKDLKKKAIEMKTRYTVIQNGLRKNLSNFTVGLNSIEQFLDNDRIILNAEEKLTDVSEILETASKNINLKISVTHSRRTYDDDDNFVCDIYNLSKREELYAVMEIKDKIKFARLTNMKNKIMVHSFDSPVEKDEIKTIWFEDLKGCLSQYATHAFLDFNCHTNGKHIMLTIEIRKSIVAVQFMKYCTGELGPVYKGSSFANENLSIDRLNEEGETVDISHQVVKVNNFMLDGRESCGSFEYISSDDPYATTETDEIICFCNVNGSIKILENYENHSIHSTDVDGAVIGTINDQKGLFIKLLATDRSFKIKDSGIIFDLEHQFFDDISENDMDIFVPI